MNTLWKIMIIIIQISMIVGFILNALYVNSDLVVVVDSIFVFSFFMLIIFEINDLLGDKND